MLEDRFSYLDLAFIGVGVEMLHAGWPWWAFVLWIMSAAIAACLMPLNWSEEE